MDSTDFYRECNHEKAANAIKCEQCKNVVLRTYTGQTDFIIKEETTAKVVDAPIDYNMAPERWKTDTKKTQLSAQLKSEVTEKLSKKYLLRSNKAKTLVKPNLKQQQPTTRTEEPCDLKIYECDKCLKTFKRFTLLKAHQLRSHTKESDEDEIPKSPVKTKCDTKVRTQKYQRTLKLNSDSENDDAASSAEDSDTALIDVESNATDLNTLYDSLTKLKQTPIGKNVYKCRLCQKITLELKDHMKHIIAHTGQKCSTCVLCEDVFMGAASLDEHMAKTHAKQNDVEFDECLPSGLIKCKECGECFLTASEFDRHKRWHAGQETQYNCNTCQLGFTKLVMLQQHKRIIHNNKKNMPKRYTCYLCEESFAFQILLTNHKRSHPEFFELIERTTIIHRYKDSNTILYACRTCGKSTQRQTTHLEHLRTHSSERPMYKCSLCSKEFTSKSTLKAHIRLHSDERQYKCEICAISYRHRRTLRLHLMKHTGKRPIKCKYCGLGFMDQNLCTEHVRRVHTGETPYQCEICGEWFTTASHVPMHKMQKHNVDTRVKRTVDIIVEKT